MRLFLLFLATALLLAPGLPSRAQDMAESIPKPPAPIQALADEGAQIRFLGKSHGFDSWLTIKNGQEQYFYVLPDGSAFVMGLLFDAKGKMLTLGQVQNLRAKGDTLLDTLAEDAAPAKPQDKNLGVQTPGEKLYGDLEASNWVRLGQQQAPVIYAFIDPQCPHCHGFVDDLRAGKYLESGKAQLRLIPVGLRPETVAQAAFLLAAPDPQSVFLRYLDGDEAALPASSELSDQGVQRNLALMHAWQLDVTPMVFYRGRDGSVKIVRGRPQDVAALVADLASANVK